MLAVVKNGIRRWQQYMVERGTYASVGIEVSTFAEECHIVHVLSEIVVSIYPSRAITFNNGSMEMLFVETLARNGKFQIFSLKFERICRSM
jgi:hypothetical protein